MSFERKFLNYQPGWFCSDAFALQAAQNFPLSILLRLTSENFTCQGMSSEWQRVT